MNEAELRQALIVKELEDIMAEIQDIYIGYRHGGDIIHDVLSILDKHIKENKQ